ncbi:fibronectin type III domain-containing protein [Geodermatophilus maliterrae]|uniref:Fibronectin type-III domain-containing protein n=1 Tax=Geodermatophilus maliterrae TaxID=3162531 RepID=A0ABV3XMC6_9ACTN
MGRTGREAARRRRGTRARRGASAGGVAGRVLVVTAVGLVALSAPATEIAAQVSASWAPFRNAGTADGPEPAPVVEHPEVWTGVPDPVVDTPVLAVPAPRRLQVELPTPLVPHGEPLETTPPPAVCGGYGNPRQIPPGVTPGAGSATVSWQADGHDEVQGYRVTAVSQQLVAGEQPPPPRATAAQRADCGEVTVTLAGLTSGAPYVFWLEELVLDAGTGVPEYVQVGWSSPVVIG